MGLLFNKYVIFRFCPKCNMQYADEFRIGDSFVFSILSRPFGILRENVTKHPLLEKTFHPGNCLKCNGELHLLPEPVIHYILKGTNYKIFSNSPLALTFIKIPTFIFYLLGAIPFLIFLAKGISRSYEEFELAFHEVYESYIYAIFGNTFHGLLSLFFLFLSIYFVSRTVIFLFRSIKISNIQ